MGRAVTTPSVLETADKGHEFPPAEFDLSPSLAQDYVEAVEDGAIRTLGSGLVPPMAIAALSIRALLEAAGLPAGAIHLGQEAAFHGAARVGDRLTARARVASRGERQGNVLMSVDMTVETSDGRPLMEGRATITFPAAEAAL